jgi:hypothetical protein
MPQKHTDYHGEKQDPALDLWAHVFGDGRGFLHVWTGKRLGDNIPQETIRSANFNYPEARKTAAHWAARKAEEGREVYFCAHLLTGAKREKEKAAEISALWVDLDGAPVPNGSLSPTAVVESSPGRFHAYWRLTDPIPPKAAEDLNKRIAREIGADPSGFDLTQLLRVPGTTNHKYDERPSVGLSEISEPPTRPGSSTKFYRRSKSPAAIASPKSTKRSPRYAWTHGR